MNDTKIEWADDTVNPWWGCQRVSRACVNCYAESLDARWHPDEKHWGPTAPRMLRVEKAIAELERIAKRGDKEGRPRRVFIASMSDFFEDRADLVEPRARVWEALFRLDGRLVPMLLTKRPEVMAAWAAEHGWPSGAWAMTTVEDQATADERVKWLVQVPARVRGLSCEPMVGRIHIARAVPPDEEAWEHIGASDDDGPPEEFVEECEAELDWVNFGNDIVENQEYREWQRERFMWAQQLTLPRAIQWVIAGGESGPKAAPSHPDWFRSLRDECVSAGVPFFFKQWGEWAPSDDIDATGLAGPGYCEDSPEDGGVHRHSWPDAPVRETARRLGRGEYTGEIGGDTTVFRVGKRAAGRLLDGVEWSEVPRV